MRRFLGGVDGVGSAPAARLALVRLLVGGYTLVYLVKRRAKFRRVNRTDPKLFAPVGPVRALNRPVAAPVADARRDQEFTLGGIGGVDEPAQRERRGQDCLTHDESLSAGPADQ